MKIDRIRNELIRDIAEVAPIEDKMRETRFNWFSHMKRRNVDAHVRRCRSINILIDRGDKGSLKILNEVIRQNLKVLRLMEDITQDRRLW